MRKIKSELCKACSELMNEMAFMPEEVEDDWMCDSILLDIQNARVGVEVLKRKYATNNTGKNKTA